MATLEDNNKHELILMVYAHHPGNVYGYLALVKGL